MYNVNTFQPNDSTFNAICHLQDVEMAREYYALLGRWLWQREQQGDRGNGYSSRLDQYYWLEEFLASQPKDPSFIGSAEAQPTKKNWRPKTVREVQDEIIAAATSTNPSIALTQVAAANGFPVSLVELWADKVLTDEGLRNKFKIVEDEYRGCIDAMRQIELEIEDPGLKVWKIQDLARKYRRTEKQLREAFCKSLISQHLAEPISYQQLIESTPEKQNWLLRGWIPHPSLVLLLGSGGAGKTIFTNHLIKKILLGESWEEYQAKQVSVIYIQSDTPLAGIRHYLEQAKLPADVKLHFHADWQIDQSAQLYNWCKKYRPGLVVIDSLTSVSRSTTVSENDTEYARPILYMGEIRRELGISFLILHHVNSEGKARGTKAVANAVDEVWNLSPHSPQNPNDLNRILSIQKSRSRPLMNYKLEFSGDDFDWINHGENVQNPEPGNNTCRTAILKYLSQNPETWYAIEELSELVNWSKDTVRKELIGLNKEGLVTRKPNPSWKNGSKEPKHYYSH